MANHYSVDNEYARINVRYSAGKADSNNRNTKQLLRALSNSSIEYANTHSVNDSAYLYENAE